MQAALLFAVCPCGGCMYAGQLEGGSFEYGPEVLGELKGTGISSGLVQVDWVPLCQWVAPCKITTYRKLIQKVIGDRGVKMTRGIL